VEQTVSLQPQVNSVHYAFEKLTVFKNITNDSTERSHIRDSWNSSWRGSLRSSKHHRVGRDAELLRVLRDDADGQEAEDEIVGFVADDLMIVEVPGSADGAGTTCR
jgi:hypothetical protein